MNTIKIKHSIFIVFAGLALSSCFKTKSNDQQREEETQKIASYVQSKGYNVQPTTSGLYYIPITEGTGETPNDSDFVLIKYKARTLDDKLFDTTDSTDVLNVTTIYPFIKQKMPLKFYMKETFFPGLTETLKKMKVGGKSLAIMPSILSLSYFDFTPKKYEIELVEVIHNIAAFERQKINAFLPTIGKTPADSTPSGLYYYETKRGTGDTAINGKIVTVKYSVRLIEGKVFQKTATGYFENFTIGANYAIPGFEEGIRRMRKGGTATIVVPYYLGYKARPVYDVYDGASILVIPWYSTLVYYLELANIQ
jgi:FKBP-type peptidyl-prolyl cis-trans isomerase